MNGVWCIVDRDYNESISIIFAEEVDALRVLNGRGYGEVVFVPFGFSISEAREVEVKK